MKTATQRITIQAQEVQPGDKWAVRSSSKRGLTAGWTVVSVERKANTVLITGTDGYKTTPRPTTRVEVFR